MAPAATWKKARRAAWTGLRKGEIGSLTTRSLNLDGDPPRVTVAARFSKHRREDRQVLHPELGIAGDTTESVVAAETTFPHELAVVHFWPGVLRDNPACVQVLRGRTGDRSDPGHSRLHLEGAKAVCRFDRICEPASER